MTVPRPGYVKVWVVSHSDDSMRVWFTDEEEAIAYVRRELDRHKAITLWTRFVRQATLDDIEHGNPS